MAVFWLCAVLLIVISAVILLLPLYSKRKAEQNRVDYDIAVYRDQLKELDIDRERNLLGKEEYDTAVVEIKRRILKAGERASAQSSASSRVSNIIMIGIIVIVLPVGSGLIYNKLGSFGYEDVPYAARTDIQKTVVKGSHGATQGSAGDIESMISNLAQRLEQDPSSLTNWLLFARSLTASGQFEEAEQAFDQAMRLSDNSPDVAIHYGEMLVNSSQFNVIPKAYNLFEGILSVEPENVRARYYVGLAKAQGGEKEKALQYWFDALALSPEDAPWFAGIKSQITTVAEEIEFNMDDLKVSDDVAKLAEELNIADQSFAPKVQAVQSNQQMDMSEDQLEMIRGMVSNLASRLKEDPSDLAGWERLIRSYEVLGEDDNAEKARASYEKAKGGK